MVTRVLCRSRGPATEGETHTTGLGARDTKEDPEGDGAGPGPAAASHQRGVIGSATKVGANDLSLASQVCGGRGTVFMELFLKAWA